MPLDYANRWPNTWAVALLIGAAAVWFATINIYPDQVFAGYLQARRWLAAAGPARNPPAPSSAPPISDAVDARKGGFVLLPDSVKIPIDNGGRWQPSKADIDGLEANLQQLSGLSAANRPGPIRESINHPERYFRQYVAIVRRGKKFIYINAFCDDLAPDPAWREQFSQIADGGRCVWQALYDPTTKTFSALSINGYA
jgi:hypothetical protein